VGRVDDDALRGNADRDGHLIAQRERSLVRRDDMNDLAFDPDHARVRLDVRGMDAWNGELMLEDGRGVLEPGGNVAVFVHDVSLRVGVRTVGPRAAEVLVLGRVWMQDRRVGRERPLRIEDGRQLLVLDLDKRGRLLRGLERIRGDRRDAVTDETHAIPREDRPVLQAATEAGRPYVRAGDHRAHARNLARGVDVDRHHARVRVGASDESSVQHPRHRDVRRVFRRAGDLVASLDPPLRRFEDVGRRDFRECHASVRARQSANCVIS
jgi:hypothetical protein